MATIHATACDDLDELVDAPPSRNALKQAARLRDDALQRLAMAVGKAMKEGYRIERCGRCGGPEVFSKVQAISRCFRCGHLREHMAVKQYAASWRRCALCNEQNMAGVPLSRRYCRECASLTRSERAKRLRWKSGRSMSTHDSTNENGLAFAADRGRSMPNMVRKDAGLKPA